MDASTALHGSLEPDLWVEVLGPLRVWRQGAEVAINGRKERRVLAVLAAAGGEVVGVDELVEALWSDDPPRTAERGVHAFVARLRAALEPARDHRTPPAVVVTEGHAYRLVVDGDTVDALRFERLVVGAQDEFAAGQVLRARRVLDDALSLWRGVPFDDHLDAERCTLEARRLEDLREVAIEDRLSARLELGEAVGLVPELDQLVVRYPMRERLWGHLMLALYRAGRQADALRTFQRARTTLIDELGIEPGPELRHLEGAILEHDPALLPQRPDVGVATGGLPGNLPLQLDSFVGHERDVTEIGELLRESRVVTLTGVGGVGKTRLALQVAADVLPRFRDGVWLVELARLRDPGAVGDAVAAAVGVPMRGAPIAEALVDFLRSRQLLLVLDNCEHLLGPTAELVRTLELACSELVVLATSREGLGIHGERLVAVRSLAEDECEQLFVDRAQAVKSDFMLTEANRPAIAEVCRRLDGIPLAIELAAARLVVLSPAQLAQRLDQRFRILAGGERGAIERHATLRAAIDWSYDLLGPLDQTVLCRLSVFAGGCTLEAAEAVCAGGSIAEESVLDLVSGLVARSLAVADTSSSGDAYYRLLETIRQYAEEHLDADDRAATNERHARYFAGWLPAAVTGLEGPDQAEWFGRADRDTENVRAAMRWAVNHADPDLACGLLAPVRHFALVHLPAGRALLAAADDVLDLVRAADGEHLALVVGYAALWAYEQGDHVRAEALADEALALARDDNDPAVFFGWGTRSLLWAPTGDRGSNVESFEHVVAWGRRAATPYDLASMLCGLAFMRMGNGDLEGARADACEALELARGTGAPSVLANALVTGARTLVNTDPETARNQLHEALATYDSLDYAKADVTTLGMVMAVGVLLEDHEVVLRAGGLLFDSAVVPRVMLVGAEYLATMVAEHSPKDAAILHGAVDTLAPGLAEVGTLADTRARAAKAITAQLDANTIRQLHDQGARMTDHETTAFAQAVIDTTLHD